MFEISLFKNILNNKYKYHSSLTGYIFEEIFRWLYFKYNFLKKKQKKKNNKKQINK